MYIQKLVLVLNIAEILLFTVADSRGGGGGALGAIAPPPPPPRRISQAHILTYAFQRSGTTVGSINY